MFNVVACKKFSSKKSEIYFLLGLVNDIPIKFPWTCSDQHLRKKWDCVIWVQRCKYWNEVECGLPKDLWPWISLPDIRNPQLLYDYVAVRHILGWGF